MKYLFIFILIISKAWSQGTITGVVINGTDNSKLPSASVFINNSTRGTTSNSEGKFVIGGIIEKNFELVISYSGFATGSIKITSENINAFHTIKLFPRKTDLAEIKIMAPEKDGWQKWGRLFTNNFIGTSDFASMCKIENPEVLRFFYDKTNRILKAYSHGNLIIHNKALGYNVRYQLEEFLYDARAGMQSYIGYTGFEDLNAKNRHKEVKWERNRKEAYDGSVMHFMRSIYNNNTAAEGFDVREKIRVANTDSVFDQIYRKGDIPETIIADNNWYKTSSGPEDYVKNIPQYIDLVNKKKFSFKDACSFDTATKQMTFYFANSLRLVYKNAKERSEYVRQTRLGNPRSTFQTSEFFLVKEEPLVIEANGLYFDPLNIMTSGYWGWCKMAELLPSDYEVEKK